MCTFSPTQLGCCTQLCSGQSCLLAWGSTTSSKTFNLSASIFGHGSCESYPVVSYPMSCISGKNQTLFRCVFWPHYHVWSAVAQHFRYGWGLHSLCKLMNTWHVYTARMSPTLNGSSALQPFKHGNAIEMRNRIMFDFYPGLEHIYVYTPCHVCTVFYVLAGHLSASCRVVNPMQTLF